ncbi:helix-turn-helix transcriptional regulator [Cupriavidus metallidurans]|uniref:helix-turn-helix transcriptional regulator n=1 Tax=Cupriavidus metallidurans TaxID=119219 RepID=UPI001BFC4E19|nr:AraC family transcriptional regulator [Cupriavidus metallidurans]QWC91549.1 helix-turn-helix transcriptional regulator [Cupriavidus metallidurans]
MSVPSTPLHDNAVFSALTQSRASLERACALGDGFGLALWRNRMDDTAYARPGHHTMSVYLEGGFSTYRRDAPDRKGAPDRLCLLPADHESRWHVGGTQRIMHLYFQPEHLAWHCVRVLDMEPRALQLQDRLFAEDDALVALTRHMVALDWEAPDMRMAANAMAHEAVTRMLLSHGTRQPSVDWRGGLSAAARRRVTEWVHAHPAANPTLGDLAALADLSEYHFARMFRISFGMPAHVWIMRARLSRACGLLGDRRLSLQQVADQAGFASASHFNNRFRAAYGVTPGQARASGMGALPPISASQAF